MTCPVEITDYQSALIAADWYEEQGHQLIAEQIRDKNVPPLGMWSQVLLRGSVSSCKSGGWSVSYCGSSRIRSRFVSLCVSARDKYHDSVSKSHNKRGRLRGMHFSHSGSRPIQFPGSL